MVVVKKAVEFEWDVGNIGKNKKHNVEDKEAEEIFFDEKRVIYKDVLHSKDESRFIVLGKTKQGKILYTAFTIRNSKVRIISARNINKKEVKMYEKKA